MSRVPVILCCLLVAGCGLDAVSAGVEAVESHTDVVAAPDGGEVVPGDDLQAGSELDASALDRLTERFPPVDVVAGPALPPRPRTVAVVGDSLTLSARDEIDAALVRAGLDVVAVDGVESRRMARGSGEVTSGTWAIASIRRSAGPQPDLWVIALGTNDVGAQTGIDVFVDDMDEVLALLPVDVPVIWVDLWIRGWEDAIVPANAMIRARLGDRPGLGAVVDWYAHGTDPGIITGDGVHLTDAGQRLFADSIVHAIDTAFAD